MPSSAAVGPSRRAPAPASRRRAGVSLLEMLVVVSVLGVLVGATGPRVANTVAHSRANQAASVIGADLERAFSLAQRMRRPVRVAFDAAGRSYTVTDATGATTYQRRSLASGEYQVNALSASAAAIVIGTNGLATGIAAGGSLVVTVRARDYERTVTATRAGLVRVGPGA